MRLENGFLSPKKNTQTSHIARIGISTVWDFFFFFLQIIQYTGTEHECSVYLYAEDIYSASYRNGIFLLMWMFSLRNCLITFNSFDTNAFRHCDFCHMLKLNPILLYNLLIFTSYYPHNENSAIWCWKYNIRKRMLSLDLEPHFFAENLLSLLNRLRS